MNPAMVVGGLDDAVALGLQGDAEHLANRGGVVDEEDGEVSMLSDRDTYGRKLLPSVSSAGVNWNLSLMS